MNMIFEESTKSCIDSTSFHENPFFQKSTDGLAVSIEKKEAEEEYREFLEKKSFLQIRGIYANFCTVLGYDIHFASVLSDKNEKA